MVNVNMQDIFKKAREYDKTKSITTAVDVAKMVNVWLDALNEWLDDEQ